MELTSFVTTRGNIPIYVLYSKRTSQVTIMAHNFFLPGHNIFSRHPLWGLVYVLTIQLIQFNPIKSIQFGIITGYWNQLVCISSLYDERLIIVFQVKQPYKLNSSLF